MPCTINASITSTGLIHSADATGVLNLQTDGSNALTVNANANVTVNNSLFVSGNSVQPLVLATQQTASGSSVDFTGIPSWVKRITLTGVGISFAAAGGGGGEVRIGSGSLTASGYTTRVATITNAVAPSIQTSTTSMAAFVTSTAAATVSGMCVLVLNDATANTWVATTTTNRSDGLIQQYIGSVSLSGVLDRISLVATTSTFDAGTVNILYE
jgi:hypothetical protein